MTFQPKTYFALPLRMQVGVNFIDQNHTAAFEE